MKSATLALLAAALVVVPSSAQAQEKIDGQYIVVLKSGREHRVGGPGEGESARPRRADRSATNFGRVLKGFSAKLDSKALAAVKQDAGRRVRRAGPRDPARRDADRRDRGASTASTSATCRSSTHVQLHRHRRGREGVHHRHRHPHHAQRLRRPRDAAASTPSTTAPADDCNGHGTHVAGTVGGTTLRRGQGRARSSPCACSTAPARARSRASIAGVDWVTAEPRSRQPAVANMSLGGGARQALDDAVRSSIAAGVTYALAAGNEQRRTPATPRRRAPPTAITVGATTAPTRASSFSNFGTLRRHLRARARHHVGVVHEQHGDEHDQRHVDGVAARRGRRGAVPAGQPERDAGDGRDAR